MNNEITFVVSMSALGLSILTLVLTKRFLSDAQKYMREAVETLRDFQQDVLRRNGQLKP